MKNGIIEITNEENENKRSIPREHKMSIPPNPKNHIWRTSKAPPTCNLIVVDNFYNNPMETRNFVLTQSFHVKGNYPGVRTDSFATPELRDIIQKYIEPFSGKINRFDLSKKNNYNGAFQYTTSRDRSWFHHDSWNNWAGIIYLTPNAPLSAGTGLYMFEDGTRTDEEQKLFNSEKAIGKASQDVTKWKLVDRVGNVFNRLVLFNGKHFHVSMDYFGDCKENGRLFQVFFLGTER